MKASVKSSVIAMSLKMNAGGKKYEIDFSGDYPEINIKWLCVYIKYLIIINCKRK